MSDFVTFLDIFRVITLLAILICQASIAHSMWMFSKHNVVAFSTNQTAFLMGISVVILWISTILLIAKIVLIN